MLQKYKTNDTEVKSVGVRKIKGLGIRFGSPETADYDNEWFHIESQLGLENGTKRPILMEHGWMSPFKKNIVAWATYEQSSEGWEYVAEFLDTELGNKAYNEVASKRYKSSAGAAGHTVERTQVKSTFRLDTWLVAEQSFTQYPADSQNPPVTQMKSSDIFAVLQFIKEDREELVKSILDSLSSQQNQIVEKTNDILAKLRDSMLKLKTDFETNNEEGLQPVFVITDDFLAEIEELTQPISLI